MKDGKKTSDATPAAVEPATIRAYLDETAEQLGIYIDDAHHTYLDVYLGRAHALEAIGAEPREVLRELWLASRCYASHGSVYLERWPVHLLRSRRLLPLELALVTGDPEVIAAVTPAVGVDAMVILAGTEEGDLTEELDAISPWFRRRKLVEMPDLAGLLAVLYWAGLTAILEGNVQSFRAACGTASWVIDDNPMFTRKASGGLARLMALSRGLSALSPPDPSLLAWAIAVHGRYFRAELGARWTEDAGARARGDGALDVASLALIAAGLALGLDPVAALEGAEDPVPPRTIAYARTLAAA